MKKLAVPSKKRVYVTTQLLQNKAIIAITANESTLCVIFVICSTCGIRSHSAVVSVPNFCSEGPRFESRLGNYLFSGDDKRNFLF